MASLRSTAGYFWNISSLLYLSFLIIFLFWNLKLEGLKIIETENNSRNSLFYLFANFANHPRVEITFTINWKIISTSQVGILFVTLLCRIETKKKKKGRYREFPYGLSVLFLLLANHVIQILLRCTYLEFLSWVWGW